MAEKEMICIVCPVGCRITVVEDATIDEGYKISGNKCKRGTTYGVKEMTNPTRMLPTTVTIDNAILKRLPVRTDKAVSKKLIFDCMAIINKVRVQAPVKMGDIIIENILDTGVNIVATRDMDKLENNEDEVC